jgi:hypothetical protein
LAEEKSKHVGKNGFGPAKVYSLRWLVNGAAMVWTKSKKECNK